MMDCVCGADVGHSVHCVSHCAGGKECGVSQGRSAVRLIRITNMTSRNAGPEISERLLVAAATWTALTPA